VLTHSLCVRGSLCLLISNTMVSVLDQRAVLCSPSTLPVLPGPPSTPHCVNNLRYSMCFSLVLAHQSLCLLPDVSRLYTYAHVVLEFLCRTPLVATPRPSSWPTSAPRRPVRRRRSAPSTLQHAHARSSTRWGKVAHHRARCACDPV
jgi:hypothetical protein